ncbi:MAG: MFS transporter, partial [Rhizomicrobium sp.]
MSEVELDLEEAALRAGAENPSLASDDALLDETFVHVTTRSERRRAFTILFISLLCLGAGQTVMFAVLPSLARILKLTEFEASLPFVASATVWVFSSGYWGRRSDLWGRKPVILLGLTAFGISFGLFAVFANLGVAGILPAMVAYPLMIAARSLYGIFGSGSAPPAIGAMFVPFGLSLLAPFYFTSLVAFASAAAIWHFLPERTAPRVHLERRYKLHWHDRRIWPFIVFGFGISTAGAVPIQTVGYLFIDELHLKLIDAPQYTMIGLVSSSLAALFAQLVIVQRFNMSGRALIRWGSIVTIASFVLFAVGRQFGPLVMALIISGLGFGMVRPGYAAAASLAVDPHEQGAIAGLTGATSGAGFIFGPLIATALYRIAPQAPYIFGAVLTTILYAYALLSPHLK